MKYPGFIFPNQFYFNVKLCKIDKGRQMLEKKLSFMIKEKYR